MASKDRIMNKIAIASCFFSLLANPALGKPCGDSYISDWETCQVSQVSSDGNEGESDISGAQAFGGGLTVIGGALFFSYLFGVYGPFADPFDERPSPQGKEEVQVLGIFSGILAIAGIFLVAEG
jgi:hypothetical protein